MITSSFSGCRMQLVVPEDTRRVVENMTRPSLDRDIRRFFDASLERVGAYAVLEAKGLVGTMGSGIANTHAISREVRRNVARRDVDAPLYDTGAMKKGIRATVDRGAMTMTLGVGGPRAFVAALHETGYSFTITESMSYLFQNRAGNEGRERGGDWRRSAGEAGWADMAAWAASNVGKSVTVQPRPFLGPAVERAVERLSTEMPTVLQDVMESWLWGRARTGNLRVAPAAPAGDTPDAEWGDAWGER